MDVRMPAAAEAFTVNYYRIAKDDREQVVVYCFQTHKGVYTFEQQPRFHRMLEAVFDNRTDMVLLRIVIPVDGSGVESAGARAVQLAQLIYPQMLSYFPPKEKTGS
jgi:hypothetical protein